jgi:CO dehydrogenase nickel-insertion accessory protein CooC1
MSPEQQTAERIARIETHLERIAVVLEKTTQDHEARIRALEASDQRNTGVLKLIGWLGAPTTAAVVVFLASKAN